MEEERNLLFNEALGALKKKNTNFKEGKSATEAKGRDCPGTPVTEKGPTPAKWSGFPDLRHSCATPLWPVADGGLTLVSE